MGLSVKALSLRRETEAEGLSDVEAEGESSEFAPSTKFPLGSSDQLQPRIWHVLSIEGGFKGGMWKIAQGFGEYQPP